MYALLLLIKLIAGHYIITHSTRTAHGRSLPFANVIISVLGALVLFIFFSLPFEINIKFANMTFICQVAQFCGDTAKKSTASKEFFKECC